MIRAFIDMLNDLPPEAKRRLLLGWLPILLVSILLCVFGGLPPTSWGLTIRLLTLLDALKTVQRSTTVSNSLNILLVQSVCTLVAWLLVILAIACEVSEFKAIQTQLRISRLQARLASLASNVLAAATATPPSAGINVAPVGMNKASAGMDMVNPPMPKNYGERVTIDNSLAVYPTNPFMSTIADAKSAKSQGVQLSSNQQDEQPAIQEDIADGPVFVYGNPFEGELPEVFRYDKELQKAVESLRNVSASKQSSDDSKGVDAGKIDLNEPDKDSE